jgi:hypothetical protein
MSQELIEEDANLELCNLVSGGMSLADARKFLSEKNVVPIEDGKQEEVKLSAAEKKELLKQEIIAIGYEPPADGASVAKFQETLDAAKEAIEAEKANALL